MKKEAVEKEVKEANIYKKTYKRPLLISSININTSRPSVKTRLLLRTLYSAEDNEEIEIEAK